MYFTQPVNFPNINIRVTLEMWSMLTKLYQYCNETDIRDVVYVFDRLMADGAFDLVAWIDDNEGVLRLDGEEEGVSRKVAGKLAQIEHEVMSSAQGGLADLAASKRQILLSDSYRNNKRRLVNTSLVEQATREFYAAEFGAELLPEQGLPGAVPLDISDQDTSWSTSILARVREYQRMRAERVGAVSEDDGSLQLLADFSQNNRTMTLPAHVPGQSRRQELSGLDYSQKGRDSMSMPVRAIHRANQRQAQRSLAMDRQQ
ncbi:hypothetical protein GGI00_006895 [Coemansia sp. RSA 2681]|nr:hypothetical protein GGI00_006895 [Coemansia sp. RSA 2681]